MTIDITKPLEFKYPGDDKWIEVYYTSRLLYESDPNLYYVHVKSNATGEVVKHRVDITDSSMVRNKPEETKNALDEQVDNALSEQIGGSHYKGFAIQPIEFIHKNNLGFIEGNIIKYICREESKGKKEDLLKVIHYARMLLELKYGVSSVFHETYESTGFIATLSEDQKETLGLKSKLTLPLVVTGNTFYGPKPKPKPKLTLPLVIGKKYKYVDYGVEKEAYAERPKLFNIDTGSPAGVRLGERVFFEQNGCHVYDVLSCYVMEGPLD